MHRYSAAIECQSDPWNLYCFGCNRDLLVFCKRHLKAHECARKLRTRVALGSDSVIKFQGSPAPTRARMIQEETNLAAVA